VSNCVSMNIKYDLLTKVTAFQIIIIKITTTYNWEMYNIPHP